MILDTQELKGVTDKILSAVDSSELSEITETLELEANNDNLYISVTNREYYVRVKVFIGYSENFHASVNAVQFLKLISQITTEDVELTCDDKALHIKGNGSYKLPLIYDGANLLVLPKIVIENPTVEMNIDTSILHSILKYNSKEIQKGIIARPIQKMYYVDENGAITFTSGACVNNFTLESPVKMLLSNKIVKLFKLFTGEDVKFTLVYDAISKSIIQTKVCFEDNTVQLTAILTCDDDLLSSVPVKNIRARAENEYPYSVTISKTALIQAINRLMIFYTKATFGSIGSAKFDFYSDKVVITDSSNTNVEEVTYANTCEAISSEYTAYLDLNDLNLTLKTCDDEYLTLKFGDGSAIVISRANILNVLPELTLL